MNKKCENHEHFLSQRLFSEITQKPMEKYYWVFVEGTRVKQT